MKNLLAVIQTPTFGGPHNQMLQLYEPLRGLGWRQKVLVGGVPGSGLQRLTEAGIPASAFELSRPRKSFNPKVHAAFVGGFSGAVGRIRHAIREGQIDLVQICGLMVLQAAIAARLERKPIVWQLLSTFAPYPVRCAFMPFICWFADIVMSTGVETFRAHPFNRCLEKRLIPFFPPVDTALFKPDLAKRRRVRAALGVDEETFLVGTLGNRVFQKGHEYFVEVAKQLSSRGGPIRFVIVGNQVEEMAPYYESAVIAEAEKSGLTSDGMLTFETTSKRPAHEFLSAFDLFLLTSRSEGAPTAALEAMATGIPVVSFRVGSVGEIIDQNITGWVVDRGDTSAAADCVDKLRQSHVLSRSFGDAARKKAVQEYDTQSCAQTHATAYRRALKRQSGLAIAQCARSDSSIPN